MCLTTCRKSTNVAPLHLRTQQLPLLDAAVELFGFGRLLFEGNWFVSLAEGFNYGRTLGAARELLARHGASAADAEAVFRGNARRVYRL